MNTKDKFIFIILFSIIGFGFYFQHLNDENLKKMDSLKDDNKDFELLKTKEAKSDLFGPLTNKETERLQNLSIKREKDKDANY